ncbi:MAG: PKD domain-containing protein [Ferruginibacter sp.]
MKILYLFILNILSLNVIGQTVNFEWTTSDGLFCAPQVVNFTNTSTGNPNSLVWRFGNGKTGNRQNESVVYNNSGTYEVKLIAIYGDVAITTTKVITINPGTNISLTANKVEMCMVGDVRFTASGSNDIINYNWDFGDNSAPINSTERVKSHSYTNFNNYTVNVTGKSQYGCSSSASTIVKINPLEASVTMDQTSGCIPVTPRFRIAANFIAEDMFSEALWDFGDGTPVTRGTSNNITHTYTTTQDITTANVKVRSNAGCETRVNIPKFAYGTPPTNLIINTVEPIDSFCASEKIQFNAASSNANYYVWNWGISNTDSINSNDATHKFRILGDTKVEVTPYLNGCAGSIDSLNIFIKGVVANYGVNNTCDNKNNFTFPSRTRGNVSHRVWTYGGNFTTVTDTSSIHGGFSYPQIGSSYVDLLLIDDLTACRDSLRTEIYTAQPKLEVNTNSVCKDSLIIYTVRGDYPSEAKFNYLYNVNSTLVNNANSDTLSYYPQEHGIFNDYLIIADRFSGTCNDTLRLDGPIKVKGPVVQFDSPSLLCYDSIITITNRSYPYFSNEPITNYSWNFGNGISSNSPNPESFNYDKPGNYAITLTVTDASGCSDKMLKTIKINPLPKVDILPGVDTICLGSTIQLIAYSSDSISWMNNSGISCLSCDTINVRPTTSTDYVVTAISQYGCINTDNSFIKVYEPIRLRVNPIDTAVCAGEKFQYNLNSSGIVLWEPSTGLSNATSASPFVTAINDIQYKVTIKDSVGCFSDSALVNLKVNQLPLVDAGQDKILSFEDPFIITPSYSSNITSFTWSNSPTLTCLTCPNPSGRMKANENLTISVVDINGCKAQDNINLILDCSTSTLMMPNAFTPNGDGLNDYFYPIAKGYSEIKNFSIFDRSGHKVFERSGFAPNQSNLGWDGTTKGIRTNTQTYVWMVQVYCQGNLITKKGIVTLIR